MSLSQLLKDHIWLERAIVCPIVWGVGLPMDPFNLWINLSFFFKFFPLVIHLLLNALALICSSSFFVSNRLTENRISVSTKQKNRQQDLCHRIEVQSYKQSCMFPTGSSFSWDCWLICKLIILCSWHTRYRMVNCHLRHELIVCHKNLIFLLCVKPQHGVLSSYWKKPTKGTRGRKIIQSFIIYTYTYTYMETENLL